MLNTLGGRFGGYGLYLVKGKPVFTYVQINAQKFRWEGQDVLTPGKHTIAFDFKYDGPGFGKGGTGVLSVDGKEVANKTIPYTIPFVVTIDESFDVGSRYPFRSGRQRLPAAVPVPRHDRQTDHQANPAGQDGCRRGPHETEDSRSYECDAVVRGSRWWSRS